MISRMAAVMVPVGMLAFAALPTGAFAQDQAAPTDEQMADAMSFAVNNAVMVLYHEVGHLFVGELGLPVLGKNEDAADSLSAVFLLEEADEWSDEVLRDAAEGWYNTPFNGKGELGDWQFMDTHSLDKQRAFFFVCMMVGNNPEYYGELATEYEMDAKKQENCAWEYKRASESWARVLEPFELGDDVQPVGQISILYEDPGEYAAFAEQLQADRFLEEAAEMVIENYSIPRDLTFRATQCSEANAYYAPGDAEIKFCYEYTKRLSDLYLEILTGSDEGDDTGADATEADDAQ